MNNESFIIPEKMQAVEISAYGGPENLRLCTRQFSYSAVGFGKSG